jgi:hypothetical protein
VAYEVDGYHPEHRAVLEVEAGRGGANKLTIGISSERA